MADRMMLPAHGRFPYQPLGGGRGLACAAGSRLAVEFALCAEPYAYGGGLGVALSPGLSHPTSYNSGWREYGNRVGAWRLLELFDHYQLPLSVLLNTACYEHCPQLIAAFRARGDDIVAHGRTNSEHQNGDRKSVV